MERGAAYDGGTSFLYEHPVIRLYSAVARYVYNKKYKKEMNSWLQKIRTSWI